MAVNVKQEKSGSFIKEREIAAETSPVSATDTEKFLEDLVQKSYYSETRHLFNIDWEIRALNEGDLAQIDQPISVTGSSLSVLYNTAMDTLARAIVGINGKPVTEIFKINPIDTEAVVNKLKEYLGKLAPEIIDKLFEAYSQVAAKRAAILEDLKKK